MRVREKTNAILEEYQKTVEETVGFINTPRRYTNEQLYAMIKIATAETKRMEIK